MGQADSKQALSPSDDARSPIAAAFGEATSTAAPKFSAHADVFAALLQKAQRTDAKGRVAPDADAVVGGCLAPASLRAAAPSRTVRLVVAAGDDFATERDALAKNVWPFIARFCKLLDLDFAAVDLDWNLEDKGLHENAQTERTLNRLKDSFDDSTISIFIGLLGDKYGPVALPTTIVSSDFIAIRNHLLSRPDTQNLVQQVLDVWYTEDLNSTPSPVFKLRPVNAILPAFSSSSSDPVQRKDAADLWSELNEELGRLLTIGAEGAFGSKDTAATKGFGKSLADLLVSTAYSGKRKEGLFCFQRTLLDLKRNANENPALASRFIDLNPSTNDLYKERISEITRLRSKHRATRFYAIPWRSDLGGFNPEAEKTHATYLNSLCEDLAKLVCESILKQSTGRVSAGAIGDEVVKHSLAIVKECEGFVGREEILENIKKDFLEDDVKKVLVLYGPSGVGKTALTSKIAEQVYNAKPETVIVARLVGATSDSSDSRSLLRSMCSQIVEIYGLSELKDKVEFEGSVSYEVADATGELTLEEKLGNLDHWPPISYEGLKAGFEIALKLADETRPLVLLLDALDELSFDDDARYLDWLPRSIPPHVKFVLSTSPTSRQHPTFSILSNLYPVDQNPVVFTHLEVPFLNEPEVSKVIESLTFRSQRQLQPEQLSALVFKCNKLRLPLYIRAVWSLYASKWSSFTNIDVINQHINAETVPGLVEDFFDVLEARMGRYFVAKALGYITAAQHGLSRVELEDLLSCDETAMNEVFKFQEMPVRRIPSIYVERLLEELGDCLVQKYAHGVKAIFWAHQQFFRVAEDRYLEQGQSGKIHSAFSNYWEAKFAHEAKQYYDLAGNTKHEARYIIDQSLLISGKPNARRISAIVWHQLAMGRSGFRVATKTLQDISHLGTAVHAGLLWDVLASYRYAMSLEYAEPVIVQQLNDYYRFLLEHAEVLLFDPNRLVPVAANLYAGSVVSDDARKWILSNSPGLNWVEWVNRPTARGEPIVTLRGTDGGSSSDVMLVTGRDTYDDRIIVAGVRTFDNQPSVFLYDIEHIEAASVGGGKAELLAKCYFQDEVQGDLMELGVPLTVAYSRKGDQIAVGSRSIVFLDSKDLTVKRVGRDPTLPAGDLITALAWTARDGCIVSASDGSQPGRIGLWDAGSLSLLKVIQSNLNPRQPITSSFNGLAFWDEGREHFAIMDVDELASDPDGTNFIQYIHNKPHSNPPPDSCARFAMSFRGDYTILAEETGLGFLLVDMKAKRPVARLEIEVDRVRTISLSHDGKRVAVVPIDSKVIFLHGITQDSKPSKDGLNLYTYQPLGTILGVDPALGDGHPVGCLFSRNGKTILTDGEYGSVRVWNVNELGDHAVVRYTSTLSTSYQSVVAIKSSATQYIGWGVNEDSAVVSLSDRKAAITLQSNNVSTEKRLRKSGHSRKDVVTGLAAHPSKPIVASVTNNGNLTLLYAEQAFHEKGWTGALRSVFSRKVEGGYSVSFNVMKEGHYISPSCIVFLHSVSATVNGIAEGSASEILSFAVGYEDGTVSVWDWNSSTSLSELIPSVTIKLGVGRITSITSTNIASSRRLALTVDDSTVVLWDGVSTDPHTVQVLVQPTEVTNSYISMSPGPKLRNRRSVTSIMSITGLLERNSDHSVAVAFSNTQEQLLATGETDGMITIWNTEAKVKRSLLIHSNDILPAPVTAIAWATDDAALVSLTEDKRVAIHNTVTGNIVWIHDLWIVSPRVNCAAFANNARDLVVLDHEGGLTTIHLHGDWPTAANADVFSPIKTTNDSNHPAIRHKTAFPAAPEPEFAEFAEWNSSISKKLVESRTIKNSRTTYQWEFSTGSTSHGHVALIRLNDGLPRGAYEVVCNVEVTEEPTVPLKFLCWTTGDVDVVDPELDVLHGFTRLVPLEEQRQLVGKGTVCLRLGFVKTSCKLDNCCIDLTRLPGEGEPITFGDVHFIPVDPSLYRPDYEHSAELADAFDHLSVDFDELEYSQGRRNSHVIVHQENLHNTDFPDLLVINPHDYDIKKKAVYDTSAHGADSGEVMWEFGQDDEMSDYSLPGSVTADLVSSLPAFEKKTSRNRKSMRMSVLESIAGVKSNMSGVVGGILTSAVAALPVGSSSNSRAKASPEDIAREMEEARRRGREQAKLFEEADEFRAAQAAKQREWMAHQIEFAQDAQRKSMLLRMQREAQFGGDEYYRSSPELYQDDEAVGGDEFDLEGVDEDIKREAMRLMREMLQKEMEHDLEEEANSKVAE
ncbi:UNVERIFIED_CONTAM: hypothetical protein HDU68_000983 [Siphonaria sp. JEL0065]|nr:hypothetical protein HDU68_000983 [Siphonaria sp. JEL0065]